MQVCVHQGRFTHPAGLLSLGNVKTNIIGALYLYLPDLVCPTTNRGSKRTDLAAGTDFKSEQSAVSSVAGCLSSVEVPRAGTRT